MGSPDACRAEPEMVAWSTSQSVTRRYGPATSSEPPSRTELPTISWQMAGLLSTVTGAVARWRTARSRRPGDDCFRSLLGPDGLRPVGLWRQPPLGPECRRPRLSAES